jgi:fatty-acyl-CoA synthase
MLEAHNAVPALGAVLCPINTRLDAGAIGFILRHCAAKVVLTDREFSPVMRRALEAAGTRPKVIDIDDPLGSGGETIGSSDYETVIAGGDPNFPLRLPADEWQAISLNYTSGTTGNPKGVVLHHRGAYLNAVANALTFQLSPSSVYLWTLPMFHCDGWTYTWAVTLAGGTHVCLRRVDPTEIFPAISEHNVTHMCGAPVVLSMLIHAPDSVRRRFDQTVQIATGGAAPPSAVIARMEEMGFAVTHLYGLTESFGPATVCMWQPELDTMALPEKSAFMARQGVNTPMMEDAAVLDPSTMQPVPADGATIGELMLRGNTVMMGYLKNPAATQEAFAGGWFHTGDLAVMHKDGYVEVKDRAKDIIISGGENISSLEVEEVLYQHPSVMEAAVVAQSDARWGETPHAFVTLKPDADSLAPEAIIAWCRQHMAHFKCPRHVTFGPLPKTSTGKIQKFELRERTRQPG